MKLDVDDYGAFVVMTTKQYVMGYNAGFGFGSHYASYARVLKDISGGGAINNDRDLATLSFKCQANYITIRICCEKTEGKHVSCMSVNIPKNGITKEQFEIFEQFYNDYNDEIEKLCNKFNCHVTFTKRDGSVKMYISNNLNEVRDYLKSIIDEEKVMDEKFEEKIIGVTPNNSRKTK